MARRRGGSSLLDLAGALHAELVAFDPAVVSGDDAAQIAEQLAVTEKACAAARARAAVRAAECRSHERRGFPDAADWLARIAGSTRGDAHAALATAAAVGRETPTGAALASGELSLDQAQVIARTEAECPGSEDELLALALQSSLAKLQDEGRRRRLGSTEPDELHRRQRRAREFRHWRDAEGMIRLAGALPPEVGVPLMNRLDRETDRIRRAAAEPEPRTAHAADALVAMWQGDCTAKQGSTDLVLVCNLAAYRRGHAHEGEPSHIVAGGPVPVSVLRRLAEDASRSCFTRVCGSTPWPTWAATSPPSFERRWSSARRRVSTGWSASSSDAVAATAWSGTTSIPSPTVGPRPTTTCGPAAGPTTGPRPSATGPAGLLGPPP